MSNKWVKFNYLDDFHNLPKWVFCNDVLFYCRDKSTRLGSFYSDLDFEHDCENPKFGAIIGAYLDRPYYEFDLEDITHYRPLPKPPIDEPEDL